MTWKELLIRHDAFQIDRWWPVAVLASQLYNIQTILVNIHSKKKMKPKTPVDFHPCMEPGSGQRKIRKSNFGVLKMLGNAMTTKR